MFARLDPVVATCSFIYCRGSNCFYSRKERLLSQDLTQATAIETLKPQAPVWDASGCPHVDAQRQTIHMHVARKRNLRDGHGDPSTTCSHLGSRFSLLPKLEGSARTTSAGLPIILLRRSQVHSEPPGDARTFAF